MAATTGRCPRSLSKLYKYATGRDSRNKFEVNLYKHLNCLLFGTAGEFLQVALARDITGIQVIFTISLSLFSCNVLP